MALHENKARSRWYTIETITDTDYTDDITLLEKYSYSSQIPVAQSGAGSSRHWSPCECKQNGVRVLIKKETSQH